MNWSMHPLNGPREREVTLCVERDDVEHELNVSVEIDGAIRPTLCAFGADIGFDAKGLGWPLTDREKDEAECKAMELFTAECNAFEEGPE